MQRRLLLQGKLFDFLQGNRLVPSTSKVRVLLATMDSSAIPKCPAASIASGTASTASAPVATRGGIGILGIDAPPFPANSHRKSLQNGPRIVAGRIHSVIDGKVPADQISTHGRVLTRKHFACVRCVRLIFPVVDTRHTGKASTGAIGFVVRFGPFPSAA